MEYVPLVDYHGNNVEILSPRRLGQRQADLPRGVAVENGVYKVALGGDFGQNSEKKRLEKEAERVFNKANRIYEINATGEANLESINEAYFILKIFWDAHPEYVTENHIRLINQLSRLGLGSVREMRSDLDRLPRENLNPESAKLLLEILINLAKTSGDSQAVKLFEAELKRLKTK